MKTLSTALVMALVTFAAVPAAAKAPAKPFVVVNESVGLPVFPDDITDRPYDVVGEIKAGVRKATIFSNEASQKKIYSELWERAEKLGADAVINAKYGESHVTALSWGSTSATGTAIKFRAVAAPAPVAAAAEAMPAEAPATAQPK